MTRINAFPFLKRTGILEPSAIQQLADGRVSSAQLHIAPRPSKQ